MILRAWNGPWSSSLGNHLQPSWCHSRDDEQRWGSCWCGVILWGLPWIWVHAPSHQGKKPDLIELQRLLPHSSFRVGTFMAQRLADIVSLKNIREERLALASVTSVVCTSNEGMLISEVSLVSSLRWDLWALRIAVCYGGWKTHSFLTKRSVPLWDQTGGIFDCTSSR